MNLKYIVICLLLSCLCTCRSARLSKLLNELSEKDEVHHQYVGFAFEASETYATFEKLKEVAAIDELVELTKSDDKVIACYAAWALCDRKYDKLEAIYKSFLEDNPRVDVLLGCLLDEEKLSSELYNRVKVAELHCENWQEDSIYYTKKLMQFDSLVVEFDVSRKK